MKKYFYLREVWKMTLGTEEYNENSTKWNVINASSKKVALNKVKKKIKEWIETWKENAEDNEYKFMGFKTDYKTYCNLRIKSNSSMDYFNLKVVPVEEDK